MSDLLTGIILGACGLAILMMAGILADLYRIVVIVL